MSAVRRAMMQAALRSLAMCVGLCLTGLAVASPVAFAEGSSTLGGTDPSSLGIPLVTAGSPTEGEQLQTQEEARRSNPEAVAEREASRTEFEGLDAEQAAKVAGEAFPELVDEPAGGPPKLPSGQSITSYLSDNAASVDVGGGKQALIESMAPIAVQTSSGERVPVDLSLRNVASVFEPRTPAVGVHIPKQLSEGVRLPGIGVSLTPVAGGAGSPLGGSGSIVGSSVLYANTQTDMDSLVKPTTAGFEADTLLRSVESPQQLYFRVGMPEGASLVQAKDGSGIVEVVEEGAVVATILPPGAQDAAGTSVPVSMSVSGDTLALSIADNAGEYQYPIEVDPEVKGEDSQLVVSGSKRSNWEFYTNNGKNEPSANFASSTEGGKLKTYGVHEYKEGEAASWVYQTRGFSKIYEFTGATEAENTEDHILSTIELLHESTKEAEEILSDEVKSAEYPVKYSETQLKPPLCPTESGGSCGSQYGHTGNAVHFQQSVVNKPTSKDSFSDAMDSGTVYISEPEIENAKKEKEKIHSTTSNNTTTEKFEVEVENSKKEKEKQKRNNGLYGSSNWLSEYDGALQFTAEDKGIGVAKSWLEYENSGKWEMVSGSEHNYLEEGLCKGVQCEAKQQEYWTLNKHLPNGEDKIRYRAEEAIGDETHQTESLETEGVGTVKVDTSKPHSIYLGGLPFGNELSEKAYKVTAYATDGEGSTIPSSGIASLAVFIENSKGEKKEIVKTGGSGECSTPKGECTASTEYTINGSELGAGHHGIVIVAKDRAGNEEREEEQVSVRHSTPVPMGPGSVDLESGDFALGPTDVSLGSGLSVSRVYSSRDLTAGVEEGSLLGPQWSLSLGSEESLIELVDKSVLVTSGNGGQTVFAAVFNSKGEPTGKFEAPPGDSNLTMTLEENEKKEKLYNLKDPAAGTSTKFTLSSTAKVWVPTEQTGPVSTDTVSYIYETVEVGGKKVTRPKEEFAVHPKVSCSPKMEPGCRALKFMYATKTKSGIGEGPTEWGEYEGRLSKISYEGYNPATKKMLETPVPVAEYSYDKLGRLRAEWDPRVSLALKTTYGYDAEGHVTALTPPGQESWVFTYGAVAGDAGTGRLLKATQAPASAGLWSGESVKYSEGVAISGTPAVGTRMSVLSGKWSGSPIAYSYQWSDCNLKGEACAPILGATNASYTPAKSDVGHDVVAQVSAINGGGSLAVLSAAVGPVKGALAPTYAFSIHSWEPTEHYEHPTFLATGLEDHVWASDTASNKVEEFTWGGVLLRQFKVEKPKGITVTSGGDVWVVESGTSEVKEYNESGEYLNKHFGGSGTGEGEFKNPSGIAYSREHLWVVDTGNDRVEEFTLGGTYVQSCGSEGTGSKQFKAPIGIAFYENENGKDPELYVTDSGNNRIESFGEDTVSEKCAIWHTYGKSGSEKDVEKEPQFKNPTGIAAMNYDGKEYMLVADTGNNRIQSVEVILGFGLVKEEFGKHGTGENEFIEPEGLTFDKGDPIPGRLTIGDTGNNRFQVYSDREGDYASHQLTFGMYGISGNELSWPTGVAVDSKGNVWVADEDNYRVDEFSESGSFIRSIGSQGEGPGQLEDVFGVAVANGHIWVTNGKWVEEYGEKGEYIRRFNGGEYLRGIALNKAGDIWVVSGGEDRVKEYSEGGVPQEEFGSEGSGNGEFEGPSAIALEENGDLWISGNTPSEGRQRVQEFNEKGEYLRQIGTEGEKHYRGYTGIQADSNGDVWFAQNPFSSPGVHGGVEIYTEAGEYEEQFGTSGTHEVGSPVGLFLDSKGNAWVTNTSTVAAANRVDKWSANHGTEGAATSPGPGWTVDYNVPVSGAGAPHNMSAAEVAKWGQKAEEAPEEATAIFPPDSPQGWPASSYTRATVYYLDGQGRLVNTATPSTGTYGSISTMEYNETNDVVRTLSPDNRATALAAGPKSEEIANLLDTVSVYNEQGQCRKETGNPEKEVAEPGTRLCETWGPEHEVKYTPNGFTGKKESFARNHTKYYYEDIANGAPEEVEGKKQAYDLVTETKELAQLFYNSEGKEKEGEEVEERASTTSYAGQGGQEKNIGWKLREPTLVTDATESEGAKVKHTTLYNENGQVIETRGPEGSAGNSAHDSKIVYYSAEENKEEGNTACGKHPEWAGLVCKTLPAKQPETSGVPNLPEMTTTYNIWNEPEIIVETFPKSGSFAEHTRTTKDEYDAAGRMKSSQETSTATTETTDKALPKITEEYNEKTGVLEKQCANEGKPCSEGKPKTITSAYNTLGQLESYTDADGNVAKFKYAGPEEDGLLEEISDSSDGGESNQKYTYSTTTKQLEKLVDSAAGTFTASYDTEGKLVSETYPNGMCANYVYNSVSEETHIEYTKTSSCSGTEGVWLSETKVPSISGEVMSKASTLASEEYSYDTLGRLTEVHETPTGEYCKTRLYEYDAESNRTKLTKYEPNSKKECGTEGGTVEKHTYDEANRLTDGEITYDSLGNVTKLPSSDAEGHALESTFYVDNAVATQTQNGVTNDYYMDPDGRVRETISGAQKIITHYDGSGEAVAWTCEGAEKAESCENGGKWTRNIPGIDGTLTAVESGKGATYETTLQLHDLEGDVVATIKDKTGETKLESTYNSTEFGAPNGGKEPPKFAWLGAGGVEKSLASGVITEGATSYVPQTGEALQSEEVAPPGLPDGSGGQAANFTASPWNMQAIGQVGAEAPGREATWEREAFETACNQSPSPGCPNYVAQPGGGGRAPLSGSLMGGGCSGSNACAASNGLCELGWKFGEPFEGELWLAVGIHCARSARLAVEGCFEAWDTKGNPNDIKNYDQFGCVKGKGGTLTSAQCAEGLDYRVWIWGWATGSDFWLRTGGFYSPIWTCEYAADGVAREFVEVETEKAPDL
jgi:hypothetical protein